MNGSSFRGPSLNAQCPGSQPCGLKTPTNLGAFNAACALASGTKAGNMESNNGSASVTPAPRRKVRRGMCFLVMNIDSSSGDNHVRQVLRLRFPIHLKRHASHDL